MGAKKGVKKLYVVYSEPYGRNAVAAFADYESAYELFKKMSRFEETAKFNDFVSIVPAFRSWEIVEGGCDE